MRMESAIRTGPPGTFPPPYLGDDFSNYPHVDVSPGPGPVRSSPLAAGGMKRHIV